MIMVRSELELELQLELGLARRISQNFHVSIV